MTEQTLFPSYIQREEEQQIRETAAQVRSDRASRAVLLYGPGGVGKTCLVRQLARASAADGRIVWLDPIDIDDSEYWLLSNLERLVASRLDPENRYFGPYLEYLSRLPSYTRPRIGHETVVSHLGRIKRVFVDCYKKFIEDTGMTVVMVLDTVEAIRGMYLLLTLTQWMKALPATLFILSGRPMPVPADGTDPITDPIEDELDDPHQSIPVQTVRLGEFTQDAALAYLNNSGVASGLTEDEKKKLVHLTRGHPLWLAFTVDYLKTKGIPEEARAPLSEIERKVPYGGELTEDGLALNEAFKRRLVAPYRDADFWHEAIKRLAVARESVNQSIWRRLMADRTPDDVAGPDEAWQRLLATPWIRPRANRRYVTLHDAVAEELAQRIIPVHDQGKEWRRHLWQRTVDIYSELTDALESELAGKLTVLDERLERWDAGQHTRDETQPPPANEGAFIEEAAGLDAQKRELCQFKAARLYYQLLYDFAEGCRQFVELLDQAKEEHDILFQDLLAAEMQRFLPGGTHSYAFGDVIGGVINDFRAWLAKHPDAHLEVGLSMARYLIDDEQPAMAVRLLDELPTASADHRQRYRLSNLQGNAYMRIPGRVKDGLPHFSQALHEATALESDDRHKLIAKAHKELGFYFRNEGLWEEADHAYQQARDAISATLSGRGSESDREEMASIQTNWAYVKGLGGHYRDGTNLVESAITVRQFLKRPQEEGISWSVCGEVYRYERRFEKAWAAYEKAEQIFHGQRNWSWLGLIYQEQAICLYQAGQDGVDLTPGRDTVGQARHLITLALDICRDQAVRGYPSALNRAGRIFGDADPDAGLHFLKEGIDWAHRLSDGWFWFANLIEYVELSYRAWAQTGESRYRSQITGREADITEVMSQYIFPDLRGRWNLVQGHLGIHDWLATRDSGGLDSALRHYTEGFAQIAERYVGSSGAAAIPGEFRTFRGLISQLTPEIRAQWQDEFRRAWSGLESGSTLLLARLEELY